MENRKERRLLAIVKYAPLLFVLFVSSIVIVLLYNQYHNELQLSKETIEKQIKINEKLQSNLKIDAITKYVEKENKKNELERSKQLIEEKFEQYLNKAIVVIAVSTLLLLSISFFLSNLFRKQFLNYKCDLEAQIIENKKQKNILLEAQSVAHIGDWNFNLQKNKIRVSNEMGLIFGFSKEKRFIQPSDIRAVVYKDDLENFDKAFQNVLSKKKDHHLIYRILQKNGKLIWIECRAKLSNDKNHLLGTVQDITEIKELEMEKQKKDELLSHQSKLASMGEMIGNIAHQLKQPLSIISMQTTSLELNIELGEDITNEKYMKISKSVNEQVQYLSNTIDDFRDFFKPENEKEEYNLKVCFQDAYRLIYSRFKNHNIEIVDNMDEVVLYGFPREMIQVIMNIMNNARDALEESKELKRKLIFVEIKKREDEVYFTFKDNAGGVSENILNKVFDAYFTTKQNTHGTGVGLFMSKEIVEKHMNGKIFVYNDNFIYENVSYRGACFELRLPIESNS